MKEKGALQTQRVRNPRCKRGLVRSFLLDLEQVQQKRVCLNHLLKFSLKAMLHYHILDKRYE